MTRIELEDILEKHKKWLNGEVGGKQANLCNVSLYGIDLCNANLCKANLRAVDLHGTFLRGADLRSADLYCADLYCADLRGADLRGADLRGADLRGADLSYANLYSVKLCDADLCNADLRHANLGDANLCKANLRAVDLHGTFLRGADLRSADLYCADLYCADLRGAENIPYIPMLCPDSGSFTAWKKANGYIVKLLIPENARRSNSTGRKCRCDKAIVLAIETVDGESTGLNEIASSYDKNFIYKVGETVIEPNFCEDRFKECAAGIHFFINRQEAVDY